LPINSREVIEMIYNIKKWININKKRSEKNELIDLLKWNDLIDPTIVKEKIKLFYKKYWNKEIDFVKKSTEDLKKIIKGYEEKNSIDLEKTNKNSKNNIKISYSKISNLKNKLWKDLYRFPEISDALRILSKIYNSEKDELINNSLDFGKILREALLKMHEINPNNISEFFESLSANVKNEANDKWIDLSTMEWKRRAKKEIKGFEEYNSIFHAFSDIPWMYQKIKYYDPSYAFQDVIDNGNKLKNDPHKVDFDLINSLGKTKKIWNVYFQNVDKWKYDF